MNNQKLGIVGILCILPMPSFSVVSINYINSSPAGPRPEYAETMRAAEGAIKDYFRNWEAPSVEQGGNPSGRSLKYLGAFPWYYGYVEHRYESEPFNFVFWNKSNYNCNAGNNNPGIGREPLSALPPAIKEEANIGAAAHPGWCVQFDAVTLTSGIYRNTPDIGYPTSWNYSADLMINVGGVNPRVDHDEIRARHIQIRLYQRNPPKTAQCGEFDANPVLTTYGAKYQTEHLPILPGKDFSLTYASYAAKGKGSFGLNWASTYDRYIYREKNTDALLISRDDGTYWLFNKVDGVWNSDRPGTKLYENAPEDKQWLLKDNDRRVFEVYNEKGSLIGEHGIDGTKVTIGRLGGSDVKESIGSVEDEKGRIANFNYDSSGSVGIIAPGIQYNLAINDEVLKTIVFPGGFGKTYLYDEPDHSSLVDALALTGILEDGKRYATFAYNSQGYTIESSHAGGVDKYTFEYEISSNGNIGAPLSAKVTQPNGTVMEKTFGLVAGENRTLTRSQPAGSGCSASSSGFAYDGRGNVTVEDDFNAKRVCRAYDATRNLEIARVEGLAGGSSGADCGSALSASSFASLPAEARKISTQWHPDWKLETRRAEPGKITTWVYNGQPDPFNSNATASCAPANALLPDNKPIVVLCRQVVQSTTDANGSQGFNATLQTQDPAVAWTQVTSRTTRYTYNQYGQVLTSTDERGQSTTGTYYDATTANYSKGDLHTVTNALGHVTEYIRYNPHGQVLETRDPNGVITSYTYDPRQRMTSVTQAGQLTQIEWWPTGLLKKVTQPDGSWLLYTYDDAHRLTDITDKLGNTVHYVLDNAGNRTSEQVKDSSGTLIRQIDQTYDNLNRLWKTTTGAPI